MKTVFTVEEVEQLMREAVHSELCSMCKNRPDGEMCKQNDWDCDNCSERDCKCSSCTDEGKNFVLSLAEQKNGWIRCDAGRAKSYNWYCPHCGEKVNYIGGSRECEYRYCPWCGKEVNK